MRLTQLFLALLFLMPVTGIAQESEVCVDEDGDGWGWNETLQQTCIPAGGENIERKNPVGIRVSWPKNPPAQMVEGYKLKLLVNDAIAAEETTRGTSLSFQFDIINATFEDRVCAQVAAFRKDQTSAYSELNCIVIPEQILPPMTVPAIPAMVWLYE